MKPDFGDQFARKIIEGFLGDIKTKYIDQKALMKYEKPDIFIHQKKFCLPDKYFTNKTQKLPLIIRCLPSEDEATPRERAKMDLIACSVTKFEDVGDLIDSGNPYEEEFFNLYTEVTAIRAE